ncbi:uncharacterized protein Dwil_GK15328 [Drosophila willistoni]|uniref:Uncharacterized protein n=2 Tax=Drosophila willistoni TaxID=7260 RepID=B4MUK4_DROWI|nr:uncharacterized protein Dwil_GK15328 [Drosophila willistoni]
MNHSSKTDSSRKPENDTPLQLPLEVVQSTPNIDRAKRLYELANQHKILKNVKNNVGTEQMAATTGMSYDDKKGTFDEIVDVKKKHRIHTVKPARYFVNSHKCKMPYADPFSHDALEIYSPSTLKSCTNESDLFLLDYSMESQQYILHINHEVFRKLAPKVKDIECNYREIVRGNDTKPDSNINFKEPIGFYHSVVLDRSINGIIAECRDAKDASRIIQQDAFSLIHVKNNSIPKVTSQRQPSVILLGLDSMSRMNFHRTMPETANWLRQRDWLEMEGYNKVGDNTMSNLLPTLTGHSQEEVEKICDIREKGCFDSLPWIWNDYKKAGYRTAYAEDIVEEAVFNLNMPGFISEPVDHYLRPFMLGISEAMKSYKRFGYKYCIGRRLSIGYVYDFCRQFTERYVEKSDQPVFGLFWSSTFTHDFYFGASSLDMKMLEYLKTLESHQLFEKAIVILFSDHGARFGDLMELPDSFLEERLPMLHIYLPSWFRSAHPKFWKALHMNRNRLSSNYDLYNTLRHILQLDATDHDDLSPLDTCRTSRSLLHPLPRDRSCGESCIEEHWCTCNEYIIQSVDSHMYQMAKRLLFRINYWMAKNHFNLKCQRLQLADIDHVERKVLFEDMGKESMYGGISIYRMRFHTYPPDGKFQATLRFNRDVQDFDHLDVTQISRLNAYDNSSLCV